MDTDKTVDATCEVCGGPAEYDSEVIICDECVWDVLVLCMEPEPELLEAAEDAVSFLACHDEPGAVRSRAALRKAIRKAKERG